jgi:hypothetical protein
MSSLRPVRSYYIGKTVPSRSNSQPHSQDVWKDRLNLRAPVWVVLTFAKEFKKRQNHSHHGSINGVKTVSTATYNEVFDDYFGEPPENIVFVKKRKVCITKNSDAISWKSAIFAFLR